MCLTFNYKELHICVSHSYLMKGVVSIFLLSRWAHGPSLSLCKNIPATEAIIDTNFNIKIFSLHLFYMVSFFFKLKHKLKKQIRSSDLSLRCRTIYTQRSAGSLPTSGPLSLTRVECSPSPESSDWSIWSCSWCQTLGRPDKRRRDETGTGSWQSSASKHLLHLPPPCSVSYNGASSCDFAMCSYCSFSHYPCGGRCKTLRGPPRWTLRQRPAPLAEKHKKSKKSLHKSTPKNTDNNNIRKKKILHHNKVKR